jgi:hypothetical protein
MTAVPVGTPQAATLRELVRRRQHYRILNAFEEEGSNFAAWIAVPVERWRQRRVVAELGGCFPASEPWRDPNLGPCRHLSRGVGVALCVRPNPWARNIVHFTESRSEGIRYIQQLLIGKL